MTHEKHKALMEKFDGCYSRHFYGFECADGWEQLILNALTDMVAVSKQFNTPFKIVQIKEKFGGLRIYFDIDPECTEKVWDVFHYITEEALNKSYKVCEDCGTFDKIELAKKGWIRSLCPAHLEAHDARLTTPDAPVKAVDQDLYRVIPTPPEETT